MLLAASAGSMLETARAAPSADHFVYLPVVMKSGCAPIPGATYDTLPPSNPATGVDMSMHPDVNLAMRGYVLTTAFKGLVTYSGPQDPGAPQLYGLFTDQRTGVFDNVYQVYKWDWSNNQRGGPYTDPPVTLAGLAATPGETIHVPDSGYDIGNGHDAMVLYAEPTRITLKYTIEDDVVFGYTIHLENVCIDPGLLALYQSLNAAGRLELPALTGGQALGRALGSEIGVAIRDTGAFMDPRARNSWWIGR